MKWKGFTLRGLWHAFRDTGVFAIVAFITLAGSALLRHNRRIEVTGEDLRRVAIVFVIVFVANSLAIASGGTTLSDNLGGPESGYGVKLPSTIAIAGIVGLISFVVLLLAGL